MSKLRRPLSARLAATRRRVGGHARLHRRFLPDYLELLGFGLVTYAVYSLQHIAGIALAGALLILIGNRA